MITCRDMATLLLDYVEGVLDAAVREQLDAHLADCPGCLAFLNTYKHTIALSRDLRCEDIPPELQGKLHSFLQEKLHKPSFWSRIRARLSGSE